MKAALPLIALAAALSACAPTAPAPPRVAVPAAAQPLRPATQGQPYRINAPVPTEWMDAPETPGSWLYAPHAVGSEATFAGRDNSALARLRCDTTGRVVLLMLPANVARPRFVEVRTETLTVTLTLSSELGSPTVAMPANLPLLDAMALSKGRFAVGADGMAPLILPSHAEVSRVIEDCR
jgi:hypothetical protein